MTFDELFSTATDFSQGPFHYQREFSTGEQFPALARVPTGLGKTAMAVLGWLWRRRFAGDWIKQATPKRLVYCLPMRVLVEQTRNEVRKWLKNLRLQDEVAVHVLMGGEETGEWDLHPECDAGRDRDPRYVAVPGAESGAGRQ